MSEPSADIKVSRNPAIQQRVEEKIGALESIIHRIGRRESNILARNDVAKDLRIEKLRVKAKNAFMDHLTEIPNRRGFNETYKLEVERAMREGHPLTLVFMDIDNFKEINDNKGHHAGDKVLTTVAKILKHSLRRIDVPVRLGSEEDTENEDSFIGGLAVHLTTSRNNTGRSTKSLGKNQTPAHGIRYKNVCRSSIGKPT